MCALIFSHVILEIHGFWCKSLAKVQIEVEEVVVQEPKPFTALS
jgi:hypothetical protein